MYITLSDVIQIIIMLCAIITYYRKRVLFELYVLNKLVFDE